MEFAERMEEKPPCEVCEHFRDAKDEPTPCQDCLPELMPENLEAWFIYTTVSGQLIMAEGAAIDLDHNALHKALDLYEVKDKRVCFERVTALARDRILAQWEKRKARQT